MFVIETPPVMRSNPPPKVILGQYNYLSTIELDDIYLHKTALGKQFVAKVALVHEAKLHKRIA